MTLPVNSNERLVRYALRGILSALREDPRISPERKMELFEDALIEAGLMIVTKDEWEDAVS